MKLTVSIVPIMIRNPWSPIFLVRFIPIIAACALPSPGSMLVRNPEKFPAASACMVSVVRNLISLLSFCGGRVLVWVRL